MTPAELDSLLLALPVGPEDGTTIGELARLLGWDDRKVREGNRLLRRGSPDRPPVAIVAETKPKGVYIDPSSDLGAFIACRNSLRGRAMDLLVTVRDMDFVIAARFYPDGHLFAEHNQVA
jgi:hypothetical protein